MEESETSKRVLVEYGADPLASLPEGATIWFRPKPIIAMFEGSASSVRDWQQFDGTLLLLVFVSGDQLYTHGSAVMVAPGVAICARHVVESHLDELATNRRLPTAWGIHQNGAMAWDVSKITLLSGADLALIGLRLRSKMPEAAGFRLAPMTTRTPRVGEELLICGFRPEHEAFERNDDMSKQEVKVATWVSKGQVAEVYPTGRDKVMLPGPSVAIECPSWGGMSGGPVYDRNGELIGLLTSSIEGQNISMASLIWPALGTEFEAVWPPGLYVGKSTLLELSPQLCSIKRREALSIVKSRGGIERKIEYVPWD